LLERCVYCLEEVAAQKITIDHVIARSWFPADCISEPKWKAPSCNSCNNELSALEGDLLGRFAMCLDATNPDLKPIVEAAMRSLDPKLAKSPKDARVRGKHRDRILRELRKIDGPKMAGVLSFGRENFDKGSRTGININPKTLQAVIAKWIRGIHYCEFNEFIQPAWKIHVMLIGNGAVEPALAPFLEHAKVIEKGKYISVKIMYAREGDTVAAIYAFCIWQKFKPYGSFGNEKAEISSD
jgi:hypothetical protein